MCACACVRACKPPPLSDDFSVDFGSAGSSPVGCGADPPLSDFSDDDPPLTAITSIWPRMTAPNSHRMTLYHCFVLRC